MNTIVVALLAALPNVLIAIFAKLFTEKFLQSVLEKVIIFGLRKAAALSVTTFDDDLVSEMDARLKERVPANE